MDHSPRNPRRRLVLLPLLALALLAGGSLATPGPAAAATTTLKVAVIPFNFTNDTRRPDAYSSSNAYIRNVIFNSPDTDGVNHSLAWFYAHNSYGRVAVTGRAFPTVRIPDTNAGCHDAVGQISDTDSIQYWAYLARKALAARGYSLAGYTQFIYIWPKAPACAGWSGRGSGGNVYISWTPSYWKNLPKGAFYLVSHEFGHALGDHHAGSLDCGTAVLAASGCTASETWDNFDLMRGADPSLGYNLRQPSAWHRYQAGFLSSSEMPILRDPGTYYLSLNPVEFAASKVKGIVVARPNLAPGGFLSDYTYLALDWHRPDGWTDNFSATSNAANGLMIRLAKDGFAPTYLLDATPRSATGSADWNDPALRAGRTFRDPMSGVTVSVISVHISSTPAASVMKLKIVVP